MQNNITNPRVMLLASGLEWHNRAGGGVVLEKGQAGKGTLFSHSTVLYWSAQGN